jgi:hypothetical protein
VNFSRREITLALATALAILAGLTYWIVSNKLPAIQDAAKERIIIEKKIAVNQRLIRKQKPLMAELNAIINTLPQHDKDKDVQYSLLQEISQQAENTQFTIIKRDPGEERKVGNTELYELSVDCTYESTIDPLVYFLYNLQAKGAVMNVSELQVKQASSRPDRKGQLKGSFVVDFAYSRVDQSLAPAPAPVPAPAAPATPAASPPSATPPAPASPTNRPPNFPDKTAPTTGTPPAVTTPPAIPTPSARPTLPAIPTPPTAPKTNQTPAPKLPAPAGPPAPSLPTPPQP